MNQNENDSIIKCDKCGYELFPLDELCDNCGTERIKNVVIAVPSKKNKKAAKSEKPEKAVKKSKTSKTDKLEKAEKPEKATKAAREPKKQSENKSGEKTMDQTKILIIIGCVFGGLVLAGCVAIAIIYALNGSKSDYDYADDEYYSDEYYDEGVYESDDFFEEVPEDYFVEEQDVDSSQVPEDIWEEPESVDQPSDRSSNAEERETDNSDSEEAEAEVQSDQEAEAVVAESEEEYQEEEVQGADVIGKTFNVGESFSYDNVQYTVTSFSEYTDYESFGEPDEDCRWFAVDISVVNNSNEEKDVDVYGVYYENGEEMYTYSANEKDSYATVPSGSSADLGVIVSRSDSASSGEYELDIGYYYGETVKIRLF